MEWDPLNEPTRPGLYLMYVEAAASQIRGGARGIVAIPLMKYGAKATEKTFYTIETEKQALDLFGVTNIQSIRFVLQGGARQVLVYTMPKEQTAEAFIEMRDSFDTRAFNVFAYDGAVDSAEIDATVAWVKRNRTEGKHFVYVTGGTAADDADPKVGNARSKKLADSYVANLIVGGVVNGKEHPSCEYAPYIAGLIAGTPINKSITYARLPLDDVNKRLTNVQINEALEAGSLVLVHNGDYVIVEKGQLTSGAKIRKIRGRQAISTDIVKTAASEYIGKLDNNRDGQAALIAAIKAYLELLGKSNVLEDPVVTLDPEFESKGDAVYLYIAYTETDSMERIFLRIHV
ncbi:phage tail sheath subtilisin-like domain-containing protein [Brevibacillus laterosporus]|uniref:phage tail sheath subtilisin-like domain-containing protein n=1 Tax=Brevibacillus laterosporus TaxID=1465 RepID=UPI000EAD831C|nr:phage tail sheath subtilisin-like domain-containing protein [Brevibacillus laterosporus]AYK07778.1 phage tail sheath protein [Brevibacillus laterosporus]